MRNVATAIAGLIAFTSVAFAGPMLELQIASGDDASAEPKTIVIELEDEFAPLHTARITALAEEGAYDNVVFHRVIEGFMAQTGDVEFGKRDGDLAAAGRGGSSYDDLPAEFSDTPFERGVVGMARSQDPNSANSQFFIMFEEGRFLDGQYTVIGKVVEGMDTVDAIKRGDANRNGVVDEAPDYIVSATVIAAE